MSVTIILMPVAIAIGMSLSSSSIAALLSIKPKDKNNLDPVETTFLDASILTKTLSEHGLAVKKESEHSYYISTECGTLHYFRVSDDLPFSLEVLNVNDMDQLITSLESLENEYGRNVQAFTYDNIMQGLSEHNMIIESEEVLEDDSVLLRLNI